MKKIRIDIEPRLRDFLSDLLLFAMLSFFILFHQDIWQMLQSTTYAQWQKTEHCEEVDTVMTDHLCDTAIKTDDR